MPHPNELSQIPTVLFECFFLPLPIPTRSLHYITFFEMFLLLVITEYCQTADDLPMLITDVLNRLVDLLKVIITLLTPHTVLYCTILYCTICTYIILCETV